MVFLFVDIANRLDEWISVQECRVFVWGMFDNGFRVRRGGRCVLVYRG